MANWIVFFLGVFGLYALAFIAGGIHYLEQQVSRIRDQFPEQSLLAVLTGIAALGIGILMAIVVGGHVVGASFVRENADARMAALVAAVAGVGFWIYRIYLDQTPLSRVRDGALAFLCVAIVLVAVWWVRIGGG